MRIKKKRIRIRVVIKRRRGSNIRSSVQETYIPLDVALEGGTVYCSLLSLSSDETLHDNHVVCINVSGAALIVYRMSFCEASCERRVSTLLTVYV